MLRMTALIFWLSACFPLLKTFIRKLESSFVNRKQAHTGGKIHRASSHMHVYVLMTAMRVDGLQLYLADNKHYKTLISPHRFESTIAPPFAAGAQSWGLCQCSSPSPTKIYLGNKVPLNFENYYSRTREEKFPIPNSPPTATQMLLTQLH